MYMDDFILVSNDTKYFFLVMCIINVVLYFPGGPKGGDTVPPATDALASHSAAVDEVGTVIQPSRIYLRYQHTDIHYGSSFQCEHP